MSPVINCVALSHIAKVVGRKSFQTVVEEWALFGTKSWNTAATYD